jgi:hypothetical protein
MDPTATQQSEEAGQELDTSQVFGSDLANELRESESEVETPETSSSEAEAVEPEPTPEPTPPPQPQAALTPEAIAAAVRAAIAPPQQQGQQQQQQQLTPEQYRQVMQQQFAVREPTQADYDTIMNGGETAVAKLNELFQANLRSAALMARFEVQRAQQQMQEQLKPIFQARQQQTRETLFGEFNQAYPELKDYSPVVELVANHLRQNGKRFSTKDEAFKTVAATVKQLVKLQPNQPQSKSQQQTTTRRTPAPVAVGGQSAGGQTAATTSSQVTPKMLFGNAET